jgi:hypothetical protein
MMISPRTLKNQSPMINPRATADVGIFNLRFGKKGSRCFYSTPNERARKMRKVSVLWLAQNGSLYPLHKLKRSYGGYQMRICKSWDYMLQKLDQSG